MKSLETPHLILRKFTAEDFSAVHGYASLPENTIYMQWGPNTEADTQAFLTMAMTAAEEIPCRNYQFAAVLKETNQLIGSCNLAISHTEAEIGWILHHTFWKQNLGTEMGLAMLTLGFDELGLRRISAHCDAENYGSYRVMEKIGMRREGLFLEIRPAHKGSDKQYSDELSYAILKKEWDTRKERD